MIVRICPMCDSEMKKAHYCDICHSWIWKPQMLDIHYNSQARGKGEIDCAYGDEHDAFHHALPDRDQFFEERFGSQYDERSEDMSSKKARANSERQARKEKLARQREKISQQRQLQIERNKEKRGNAAGRKANPGAIIFLIVIIYVIINFILTGVFHSY